MTSKILLSFFIIFLVDTHIKDDNVNARTDLESNPGLLNLKKSTVAKLQPYVNNI